MGVYPFLLYIGHRSHFEVDEGASGAVFFSFLMAKALDQNSWMNGDDLLRTDILLSIPMRIDDLTFDDLLLVGRERRAFRLGLGEQQLKAWVWLGPFSERLSGLGK